MDLIYLTSACSLLYLHNMKEHIRRFLYLLILLGISVDLYSNNPYIININKNRYGAANKNWSIGQDERGVVYFGNDNGLLEFDGFNWKINTIRNFSIVRAVAVFDHHTIFTCGYEDFGRWDRDISGQLKYTSLASSVNRQNLINNDFWKILIVGDTVYFQSFSSIYVYKEGKVELVTNKSILFLLKVRNEYWVQGMQDSLYKLSDDKLVKIEGSEIFKGKDVRIVLPYDSDRYLIGTSMHGLYLYDGQHFSEWNCEASSIFKQNDLNCGILSSHGTYYFGTIINGLYEVDLSGKILNHFSTETKLQNNTVLDLFEDSDSNFWVALDKGVSYIQYLDNMDCYTDPTNTIGAVYDAVLWHGNLVFATNQGVFYIPQKELGLVNPMRNLKFIDDTQGQAWGLYIEGDELFCRHNRGLKVINPDMHVLKSSNKKFDTGLYSIQKTVLRGTEILLMSTYEELKIMFPDNSRVINVDNSHISTLKTEVDHLGNVWAETPNKGVYRYLLNDSLTRVKESGYYGGNSDDNLPYKLSISKVGGRITLLGDGRFYTYNDMDNTMKSYRILDDCFSQIQNLKKIVYIKGDLYWAIGDNTVFKFYCDGHSACILESYDIGIHNISMVDKYENISILNDSLSLICLDNGFLLYNDKTVHCTKNNTEKIYIDYVQIKNGEGDLRYLPLTGKSDIPYTYNSIAFYYLSKGAFNRNLYFQHKLEGVDSEWSASLITNKIEYERLPSGKYNFMIRTVDNLGNISEIVSYDFTVLKPWYLTFWAYVGYIIVFLLIAYLVWIIILRRYRNIHLQKIRYREAKRLQAANEKLQREIQDKNAELFTQTSFTIQKNQLIMTIKELIDEFYHGPKDQRNLLLFYRKIETLLNNNLNTDDDWKMFLIKFEEKHPYFFKRLKDLYPQLTANDLKLCACLKLNFDSKDIASFMNMSVRAVENSRHRLRKKIDLSAEQKLSDFIMSIE